MLLPSQFRNKCIQIIKSKPAKLALFFGLVVMAHGSFAEDVLAEAEGVVKDAYNGSIKTYLYIGEAVAAVIALIFTRNIKTLGGVGAIAIFLNVVTKLAGI